MEIGKIITIVKKELLLYVASFSNFLVLAGVLTVMSFLFFNNFYNVGVSDLNDLFGLFPAVFGLLVPALVMGIFARERQERTLYYLLSKPVSELELVVGKYLAGWLFLSIFPLVTLLIPISLNGVAQFDMGVIAAGYLASILLIGMYLSVNLFISSLFSNQLAVFVVSLIANVLLLLLGTGLAGNILPAVLVNYVSALSPMYHFTQIARGILVSGDLIYFALTISAFLLLTLWQVRLLRGGGLSRQKIFAGVSVQALAVGFLVAAYFATLVPGKIDLTDQKLFTLAIGTQNIVKSLTETVTIDVYLTEDLPAEFRPQVDDVRRVMGEIKVLNSSKVTINFKYPDNDPAVAQEAQMLGIVSQPFTVVSQTEYQAKNGYFGINIKYQDKNETIPFVGETSDIEYQLVQRIYALSTVTKPVIAVLGMTGDEDGVSSIAQGYSGVLAETYTVKTVTFDDKEGKDRLSRDELNEIKAIVLSNLGGVIHPDDANLIKAMVADGVGLVVFQDGVDIDLNTLNVTKQEAIPMNELLSTWGITVNNDIVYDPYNANVITFNTAQGRLPLPYAYWPSVKVENDLPLLSNLKSIVYPWGSSLTVSESEEVRPLVVTSSYGGSVTDNFDLKPDASVNESDLSERTLAVYLPQSENRGAIIVVGSTNIIRDQFNNSLNNNIIFGNLAVNVVTQNTDLASIKAKDRIPPQLVFGSKQQKDLIRFFNIIGGPVLVVLIGGVFGYVRRRKTLRQFGGIV